MDRKLSRMARDLSVLTSNEANNLKDQLIARYSDGKNTTQALYYEIYISCDEANLEQVSKEFGRLTTLSAGEAQRVLKKGPQLLCEENDVATIEAIKARFEKLGATVELLAQTGIEYSS
jgi:hypothetical protein